MYSGILMETTIDNKLIYIPDDNTQNCPFCRIKIWTLIVQPSFNKSSQKFLRQKMRDRVQYNLQPNVPFLSDKSLSISLSFSLS